MSDVSLPDVVRGAAAPAAVSVYSCHCVFEKALLQLQLEHGNFFFVLIGFQIRLNLNRSSQMTEKSETMPNCLDLSNSQH